MDVAAKDKDDLTEEVIVPRLRKVSSTLIRLRYTLTHDILRLVGRVMMVSEMANFGRDTAEGTSLSCCSGRIYHISSLGVTIS